MHRVTAPLDPDTVTVLSVELGSISDAIKTEAFVISRISLIFHPPFPINDPQRNVGAIRWSVTFGQELVFPAPKLSCKANFKKIEW